MLDPLEAAFAGILFILLLSTYFAVVSLKFLYRLVRSLFVYYKNGFIKRD
jgi:hypothetical protein